MQERWYRYELAWPRKSEKANSGLAGLGRLTRVPRSRGNGAFTFFISEETRAGRGTAAFSMSRHDARVYLRHILDGVDRIQVK